MILIPCNLNIHAGNQVEIIVQDTNFRNKEKCYLHFKLTNELIKKFDTLKGNEKVIIKNNLGSYAVVNTLANIFYSDMLRIDKCYHLFYGTDGINNTKHFVVSNLSCCARPYCQNPTNLEEKPFLEVK
jgi:hypothetical protein